MLQLVNYHDDSSKPLLREWNIFYMSYVSILAISKPFQIKHEALFLLKLPKISLNEHVLVELAMCKIHVQKREKKKSAHHVSKLK